MDNQVIRLFILFVLLLLLTSDLKDLLEALSTTVTLGPYLSAWRPGSFRTRQTLRRKVNEPESSSPSKISSAYSVASDGDDDHVNVIKFYADRNDDESTNKYKQKQRRSGAYVGQQINPNEVFNTLSDDEKQELLAMRSKMAGVMQEWCLPKLVCELHASIGDRVSGLSEAEAGLISVIRDTSINPMGESSKYHFAAHMGQLLANVDGNGCHNFYPSCPLSGTKVLQMVKKVRIR